MKCFLFLFVLCCSLSLFSQAMDPSDYLKSYRDQSGFLSFDQYEQQVGALRFSQPVVDELNFRTETDQFNLSRQEYALRLMFNGWGAGAAYALEKKWIQNKIQTSKQRYGSELLWQRYQDLCDLYFYEQQVAVDKADSLLTDSILVVVVKNMMADEEHNLSDAINWENKKAEIAQKLREHRNALALQLKKMNVGEAYFDWAHWADPGFMKKNLEAIANQNLSLLDTRDFEADSALITQRWHTSKSNDHKILDFAQLRYSKRDNLLFQDEFSIGFGLRLPYKGTQKRQSNEYRLDLLKIQQEKRLQAEENANAFAEEQYRFLFLLQQWASINDEVRVPSLLNQKNPEVEQALELEKKKREVERWHKRLEVEKKLTLQYLKTLFVSGALESQPTTNFLSTLLPSF